MFWSLPIQSRSTILFVIFIILATLGLDVERSLGQPSPNSESTSSPPRTQPPIISVGIESIDDDLIEQRLRDVYGQIPSLSQIRITVKAGVVQLDGQTPTKEDQKRAVELAQRVEGVVSVSDDIKQKREVQERLTLVQERLTNHLNEFISYLPLLTIALTVFLCFWVFSSFISRRKALFQAFTRNVFLQGLLRQTVRGAILFIGFIVMLEILDATALLGTIVGLAGVMGLALGFALRDTVENYIASILLSLRQPFRPLDHIVLESYEGLVMKLTSRETILMTLDGNHVRIPNSIVYKGIMLNYTRNPKRRFSFEVGIDTAVDIEAARQLAISTLTQTQGVITDPPVRCTVEKLGDSNVILKMFAWTTQDQFDFKKVSSQAIRAVKEAFDLANYEMPEPIYRLKVQGISHMTDATLSKETEPHEKSLNTHHNSQSRVETDVSKDNHLSEQISKEKRASQDAEVDLLESN